jgi:hypothetical protein
MFRSAGFGNSYFLTVGNLLLEARFLAAHDKDRLAIHRGQGQCGKLLQRLIVALMNSGGISSTKHSMDKGGRFDNLGDFKCTSNMLLPRKNDSQIVIFSEPHPAHRMPRTVAQHFWADG